jgi:hypothetical protein
VRDRGEVMRFGDLKDEEGTTLILAGGFLLLEFFVIKADKSLSRRSPNPMKEDEMKLRALSE